MVDKIISSLAGKDAGMNAANGLIVKNNTSSSYGIDMSLNVGGLRDQINTAASEIIAELVKCGVSLS